MTDYFYAHDLLIKDFTQWAEPLNQVIRERAEQVAAGAGLKIAYLAKAGTNKEELVQQILPQPSRISGGLLQRGAAGQCNGRRVTKWTKMKKSWALPKTTGFNPKLAETV